MEKLYDYIKMSVTSFKLELCCCLAPIRVGLLIIGYFNIFISLLSLVDTADGGITPPLMAVQELILEDNASKPVGILAYATELAFSMLLLCAMYRNDIILLRMYMYFEIAAIIASLLVYSMVIAAISLLTKILIIGSMVFQCYVIILVRSAIVEIKATRSSEKNGHVTLYSVTKVLESDAEPAESAKPDPERTEPQVKVETVDEQPKE